MILSSASEGKPALKNCHFSEKSPPNEESGKPPALTKHQIEASATRPRIPLPDLSAIPAALKGGKHFVAWRYDRRNGAWSKVPYQIRQHVVRGRMLSPVFRRASAAHASTWMTFDDAASAILVFEELRRDQFPGCWGIGYVLTPEAGIAAIDLDDCRNRDTGVIVPWAQAIIDRFETYSEVSPSGTGVKLYMRGTKPAWARCRSKVPGLERVEIYDRARFLALTGDPLPGCPVDVAERQAELETFCREMFPEGEELQAQRAAAAAACGAAGQCHDHSKLIERARAYVAKLPPAIQGQNGSGACFHAACSLVLGFDLTPGEAYPLLVEYSDRCQPPWSEPELWHKLRSADGKPGPRGQLRDAQRPTGVRSDRFAAIDEELAGLPEWRPIKRLTPTAQRDPWAEERNAQERLQAPLQPQEKARTVPKDRAAVKEERRRKIEAALTDDLLKFEDCPNPRRVILCKKEGSIQGRIKGVACRGWPCCSCGSVRAKNWALWVRGEIALDMARGWSVARLETTQAAWEGHLHKRVQRADGNALRIRMAKETDRLVVYVSVPAECDLAALLPKATILAPGETGLAVEGDIFAIEPGTKRPCATSGVWQSPPEPPSEQGENDKLYFGTVRASLEDEDVGREIVLCGGRLTADKSTDPERADEGARRTEETEEEDSYWLFSWEMEPGDGAVKLIERLVGYELSELLRGWLQGDRNNSDVVEGRRIAASERRQGQAVLRSVDAELADVPREALEEFEYQRRARHLSWAAA